VDRFRNGYPNLAAFLDSHENFMLYAAKPINDCRAAHLLTMNRYRRFGYLQSRLLLQKQDELRILEERLDQMDQDDMQDMEKLRMREKQGSGRTALLRDIEEAFCKYGRHSNQL
jgi:hypothetical protein